MQERIRYKWTPEKENELIELRGCDKSYKEIAEQLNLTKSQTYLKGRTLFTIDGKVAKKRQFTPEEDDMLIKYCTIYRRKSGRSVMWNKVIKYLPERSIRQCKDRWLNFLSPDTNVSRPWTKEEDEAILEVVKKFGSSNKTFSMLGKRLKRSGNSIKNHYFKTLGQVLRPDGSVTLKRQIVADKVQRQIEALNNANNDIDHNISGNEQSQGNQIQNNNSTLLPPIFTFFDQVGYPQIN